MGEPKRYGSRGTIKRDKPDDTIANPNEKEQRARNQAMWGTETMLHEFWKQNIAKGNEFWGWPKTQNAQEVPRGAIGTWNQDNSTKRKEK